MVAAPSSHEEFWDAIQDGLYDMLQDSWSVILFQMGLKYDVKVGQNAGAKVPDVQQAVKFLELYGLMAG
ncbi:MAG TPA: hypothetical protein VHA09_06190 [Nitrososphaera sp.]|nr:hypothetical protein [Nitrososphaera sp.]